MVVVATAGQVLLTSVLATDRDAVNANIVVNIFVGLKKL